MTLPSSLLRPAALLAAMMPSSVAAQDATWTPLSVSGEHVIFVLGAPETIEGARQITLAIVPPAGTDAHQGQDVGFYLNFYDVDCASWTSHLHTLQVFGPDAVIFSQGDPGRSTQPIEHDANALDLAARLKCRSDPPAVSGAVGQSHLIEAADALRDATDR